MAYKKTVCIDFDGVIHSYTSGWDKIGGACSILDGPVPGAFEAIASYVQLFDVVIFSTRGATPGAPEAMHNWFHEHGMPEHVLSKLTIHGGGDKPKAVLYIDDRGYQFDGSFPSVEYIDKYKPWNKK